MKLNCNISFNFFKKLFFIFLILSCTYPIFSQSTQNITKMKSSKDSSKKDEPKKDKVKVASSLGGHNKHLVFSPFDIVDVSDFEIGTLYNFENKAISKVLNNLEEALKNKTLPYSQFSSDSEDITKYRYKELLSSLPNISSVRFSDVDNENSNSINIFFRIITKEEATFLNGFVILSKTEDEYKIDYIDIDFDGIENSGLYDPYTNSRQ